MIILNEKKYVEDILSEANIEPAKASAFLSLYARYLYSEQDLRKTGIIRELNQFMESHYPRYNPIHWEKYIDKYAEKADRYPLCVCSGIGVTQQELDTITKIQDNVLERLAFTLLCLSKFCDYRNPDNHHWVSYSNGEIYSMACINTTAFEKDKKIHTLKELGLIRYARQINNLSIQILYIEENSPQKLFITDFRKLGYEWRLYRGEKYIRCRQCGLLAKNTNGKRKYCKNCAENRNKMQAIKRYHIEKCSTF